MNKRDQIQQEILQVTGSTYGRMTDKCLVMMDRRKKNMIDYYVYDSNGEFVKVVKGKVEFNESFKCNPSAKSFKWQWFNEYKGLKVEPISKRVYLFPPAAHKAREKKVLQYTLEGEFVKEWDSIAIASKHTNTNKSSLSACLNNKNKTAGGFIWKYK